MTKPKPKYKKGDKVCVECSKIIDKKNQRLPWKSEQLKAKDEWIDKLLLALTQCHDILTDDFSTFEDRDEFAVDLKKAIDDDDFSGLKRRRV